MKQISKKILSQYKKVESLYCKTRVELGILSCLVSDAVGEDITVDLCSGGEIDFREGDEVFSCKRIEDIIDEIEARGLR